MVSLGKESLNSFVSKYLLVSLPYIGQSTLNNPQKHQKQRNSLPESDAISATSRTEADGVTSVKTCRDKREESRGYDRKFKQDILAYLGRKECLTGWKRV